MASPKKQPTKAKSAPPKATPKVARVKAPAPGSVVAGAVMRARTDEDVLTGHFCEVVKGPHEGRYGVYQQTVSSGSDGFPESVSIRTRDANDEFIQVAYGDIRPAEAGGR